MAKSFVKSNKAHTRIAQKLNNKIAISKMTDDNSLSIKKVNYHRTVAYKQSLYGRVLNSSEKKSIWNKS